jgi:hypothetical protein
MTESIKMVANQSTEQTAQRGTASQFCVLPTSKYKE